jgi:integrase
MRGINGGDGEPQAVRPVLVTEFVSQLYLPYYRLKWKESTKVTSESRIQCHIVRDLGDRQLESFTPTKLQEYLESKAATYSFSVVDHLRGDLTSICTLAVAEKVLTVNPATSLYIPRSAKKGDCPVMTSDEVEKALGAVDVRDKVVLHLAILSGLRPGEMLAMQRP